MQDQQSECQRQASLTAEQLRAFADGWAVTIMPACGGWKVRYFSSPTFEDEPGSLFAAFDDVLSSVKDLLPALNSPAQRERARQELMKFSGHRDSIS